MKWMRSRSCEPKDDGNLKLILACCHDEIEAGVENIPAVMPRPVMK